MSSEKTIVIKHESDLDDDGGISLMNIEPHIKLEAEENPESILVSTKACKKPKFSYIFDGTTQRPFVPYTQHGELPNNLWHRKRRWFIGWHKISREKMYLFTSKTCLGERMKPHEATRLNISPDPYNNCDSRTLDSIHLYGWAAEVVEEVRKSMLGQAFTTKAKANKAFLSMCANRLHEEYIFRWERMTLRKEARQELEGMAENRDLFFKRVYG
ncbi:MAG: hypothetical protein M1834_007848 [Cirrosporium novae-zelandiae]|nr:MAG: hypothetical protein M1834_007848 [Cirrosporium novae-zelandiae]